ncbi:YdcF family protein [Nakamurella aerolata]
MALTAGTAGRWLGRAVGGLLVLMVVIAAGLFTRMMITANRDERQPVQAIVVLGAAQYNGRPSPVYQARLDHAYELWQQRVAPLVVTVGGNQPGDRTTEGAAGRAYLAERGVPASDLLAVPTGGDTLASLRAAQPELAARSIGSVVLVSDPAHVYRAALMAGDLGLRVTTSPERDGPTASGAQTSYFARELAGSLFYLVTGGSSNAGGTVE